MNLFVLALALIANSCVAFVPPVVLVQLSSPSFNSHLDFRKTAKEATVEMNMVKAAKEATAEMMRKPQVVAEIMERAGLNKTQAEAALVAFTETIVDCVSDGKKINLQGFGTFESRERSGRQGRNPRTGEPIEIKATTVPAFSASKAFKEQVKAKSTS